MKAVILLTIFKPFLGRTNENDVHVANGDSFIDNR